MECAWRWVAYILSFLGASALLMPLQLLKSGSVEIVVDLRNGHPVPVDLFGIFFEEINHAGDGGLYAELINDRSFDGLAYEAAFLGSESKQITLPYPLPPREAGVNPPSWHAKDGNTTLSLTKEVPMNDRNTVALNLTSAGSNATVFNEGYWGISISKGFKYHLRLYLQGRSKGVQISLESQSGETYATTTITAISEGRWQEHTALLISTGTDINARLAITAEGEGPLLLDFVSLFPEENGVAGSKSPFRHDLLEMLKALKPGAVRLPGGCYVEGQRLENGFYWEPSVRSPEQRPGHWNGPWRYWSTDGLGLYEYMQLAEELEAKPIWVFNNGLAHENSIPTARIRGMVEDTLASLEFVKGNSSTKWGKLRAEMGHPEPWQLEYLSIGNEDCGKPYYTTNYLAFYEAIRVLYPDMKMIANCDMEGTAPADLWDWHWYTDSATMFNGRWTFDATTPELNGSIYASEYAVFDWGITTAPGGNLQGAIAEAGFMTGLERNSETVSMAAFAPLLVHANHTNTCPSNLIMYNGARAVKTSSYYVQQLFREYQGVRYLETTVDGGDRNSAVAASAVCMDVNCDSLAIKNGRSAQLLKTLKRNVGVVRSAAAPPSGAQSVAGKKAYVYEEVVNFEGQLREVSLKILDFGRDDRLEAEVITLTSDIVFDSNTLDEPYKVVPIKESTTFLGRPRLALPAYSLSVVLLNSPIVT